MEKEKQLIFPEGLSEKDIELIREQCEHQGATSNVEILGFAESYKAAKEFTGDAERMKTLTPEMIKNMIMEYGALADPRNAKGFRTTIVRFKDFSQALEPDLVPRAIESFAEAYAEGTLTPDESYAEFEKIHPFEDGNGRVGDLLWKIAVARETGKWPESLPPDIFGEKDEK